MCQKTIVFRSAVGSTMNHDAVRPTAFISNWVSRRSAARQAAKLSDIPYATSCAPASVDGMFRNRRRITRSALKSGVV